MYACPICKKRLTPDNACHGCGFRSSSEEGIPVLLTHSKISERYREVAAFYNQFYVESPDPWVRLSGRGGELNAFIAGLISKTNPTRFLEIGCGEGGLLDVVKAPERFGMDLSLSALSRARKWAEASLCVGICEELPFLEGFFDCIASVGVITHLLDDVSATSEVFRVLRNGGEYIVGVYVKPSLAETAAARFMELRNLHSRPVAALRWAALGAQKALRWLPRRRQGRRPDWQPVERFYSHDELVRLFQSAGFEIRELITKLKRPEAPLSGQHFRLYVLRKGFGPVPSVTE
jgi:SAM-dependent methyltransferase